MHIGTISSHADLANKTQVTHISQSVSEDRPRGELMERSKREQREYCTQACCCCCCCLQLRATHIPSRAVDVTPNRRENMQNMIDFASLTHEYARSDTVGSADHDVRALGVDARILLLEVCDRDAVGLRDLGAPVAYLVRVSRASLRSPSCTTHRTRPCISCRSRQTRAAAGQSHRCCCHRALPCRSPPQPAG
jgi:hypothetical protein